MGRGRPGLAEHRAGQIPDIAVRRELHPGIAVALVEDGDGLAHQRLGVERGVRRGKAAERRRGRDDAGRAARREAFRLHPAAQLLVGEVGPDRVEAGIEGGVRHGADPSTGR